MAHAPEGKTLNATAGFVTLATIAAMALVIYAMVVFVDLAQAPLLTQDIVRLSFRGH